MNPADRRVPPLAGNAGRTPAEIARKRVHEHSILFIAGVLGHWVTDLSRPMHTSIHTAAWHPSAANPQGCKARACIRATSRRMSAMQSRRPRSPPFPEGEERRLRSPATCS